MRKTISIKFNFGDEVRLRTDPEKTRIVIGISVRPGGKIYELAWGEATTWHQEIEIEHINKVKINKVNKVKGFGRD